MFAGRQAWSVVMIVGQRGHFATCAMAFADDGPALRADQVRPADRVTAFGEGLRVPGRLAPGGVLTVHRVRLPGLRAAPARTGAGKPGFYDYYSYKITSVDAGQILAPEGSSPLGRSRAGVLGILRAKDGDRGTPGRPLCVAWLATSDQPSAGDGGG
jgi:hypothetical protein